MTNKIIFTVQYMHDEPIFYSFEEDIVQFIEELEEFKYKNHLQIGTFKNIEIDLGLKVILQVQTLDDWFDDHRINL